jgi:hypothetical protein
MLYEPIFELSPGAYEKLTVSTAVVKPANTTLKPTTGPFAGQHAKAIMITVEGTAAKGLRFKQDGGTVSATDGHLLLTGDVLVVSGLQALANLQFIRASDADNVLHMTSYF